MDATGVYTIPVTTINTDKFHHMMKGASIDRVHTYIPCAVWLPSGVIAKVFVCGPIWSSSWWRPVSDRFVDAALGLKQLGFSSIDVLDRFHLRRPRRDIVTYTPLPGENLRVSLRGDDHEQLFDRFAIFLAKLHEKGVYFRGIHFGNVIVALDGQFGLVDVSTARFFNQSLPVRMRVRNFRHFALYRKDMQSVCEFGMARLIDGYLAAAGLNDLQSRQLRTGLARMHPVFKPEINQ